MDSIAIKGAQVTLSAEAQQVQSKLLAEFESTERANFEQRLKARKEVFLARRAAKGKEQAEIEVLFGKIAALRAVRKAKQVEINTLWEEIHALRPKRSRQAKAA